MIVLGIDGGITQANGMGLALIETDPLASLELHTITPRVVGLPSKSSWEDRLDAHLHWLDCWLAGLPLDRRPALVAYETVWFGLNEQTTIKLAMLTGGIRRLAQQHGIPRLGIAPSEAKIALTKRSEASKSMMKRAARQIFCLEHCTPHEADAIGVGLAAEAQYRLRLLEISLLHAVEVV